MRSILLFFFAYLLFVHGKLKTKPESQTVLLGQSVLLNCSLFPATSLKIHQYQWRGNNGQMLGLHEPGILPGNDHRYHYVSENPDELNLLIQNIRPDDDGNFECQMNREGMKRPERASANITVLVPPSEIQLVMSNSSVDFSEPNLRVTVNSGDSIHVTCSVNVKPDVVVKWYVDNSYVNEVRRWKVPHDNKTVTSFADFEWNTRNEDDGKIIECLVNHTETKTVLRKSFTLNVQYADKSPLGVSPRFSTQSSQTNATISTAAPTLKSSETPSWFTPNPLFWAIIIGCVAVIILLCIALAYMCYKYNKVEAVDMDSERGQIVDTLGGNSNDVKIYGVGSRHSSETDTFVPFDDPPSDLADKEPGIPTAVIAMPSANLLSPSTSSNLPEFKPSYHSESDEVIDDT